jgi:hypothetical protein
MRTSFVYGKRLMLAGIVGVVVLAAASAAVATTARNSDNPDLTVTVSLLTDRSPAPPDPNFATVGDEVDVVLEVQDNRTLTYQSVLEEVKIRLTLEVPGGEPYSVSYTIYLFPGQRLRVPFDVTVTEYYPKGTYSLTIEATEVDETTGPRSSKATASITVI